MPTTVNTPPIILASGSPRRKELLASLELPFEVIPSTVDEGAYDLSGRPPEEVVCFLSRVKADDVAKQHPGHLIIGSDTIVVLNGEIFGKPTDEEDAARMLSRLQGTTHTVYSGITVVDTREGKTLIDYLKTDVTMKSMGERDIRRYIATGEPMDKAGAYAIQGYGSLLVEKIDGCYFNVVGMSLYLLNRMLGDLDYGLL